ncbi:MAG TPA: hypothetical protein VN969_45950 [Streptosporangiaceae bacterium]|nr:hypothetical protein [Streptosporangiaceae bacterium]
MPGLLAGLLIPAIAAPHPPPPSATTVGMIGMNFAKKTVYLHVDQRLTLVNSSILVHVIGPGEDAHIVSPERGDPVLGFHLMQTNSSYVTGEWLTPGTFHLTCSVHPMMNLTVVVIR